MVPDGVHVLGGSGLGFGLGLVEEQARGKANSSRGTRRHVGALAWRAALAAVVRRRAVF